MGREMTLRGVIKTNMSTNSATAYQNIESDLALSYESPDRTKGWKVTGAWAWIDTEAQNSITSNNNPALTACLSTDELTPGSLMDITTAADNRLCGWTQIHYRGFDTGDYFVPHASIPESNRFLIDFDRIVTNDLYIYGVCVANGGITGTMPVDINYMISLEEVTLSPSQSVLQQLKGIGQDVVN